ncbi:DUF4435 domain-containing protein [Priestia megaterium]|uniref:DUF4435 domain-containing protein n=1 Tax=Priestia megaterium TaxID=1404 RepID=UPI0015CF15F5|nr:DUF4435 domain-containing protein [Priestia megaterium]
MCSLLQEMWDSSEDIEAIFQEYILRKDDEDLSVIYCFFEGEDDYKYYVSRIEAYTEKETICHTCNGKDNVLTLHGMIKDSTVESPNNKLLFFIDKDFDMEKVDYEDVYTTPSYAIENFYITDTAISKFLKGEFKIDKFSLKDEDKLDFENGLNYFKGKRDEFIDNTLWLNVWYSLQKNKSGKNPDQSHPNLSQLKNAYNRKFTLPISIEELKSLTPDYIEVTDIEIQNEKNRLMEDAIYNFRGKYFEEFLYKILNFLMTDSNKPEQIFTKKRKVNLTIGKDNLISNLSQYADTPICLKDYLKGKLTVEDTVTESEIH